MARRPARTGNHAADAPPAAPERYWAEPAEALLEKLATSRDGLAAADAASRLRRCGENQIRRAEAVVPLRIAARQFGSPLIVVLLLSAVATALTGDWTDAAIIAFIVLGSATIGGVQEYRAARAVAALRQRIAATTRVLRDGRELVVPSTTIVPGDVVALSAGTLIPADGIVLEARDLFVMQDVLTGESIPVEKSAGAVPAAATPIDRSNSVFMATSVRSGTGRMVVTRTGQATMFGAIAERLRLRPPETDFERGLRRYAYLLTQIMFVLVLVVFGANAFLHRSPVESLLFAIAIAVGISPELLPAIVSVTLAKGAIAMARRKVIVRHLSAIENLGSIDILCSDKTGTLTEGRMRLLQATDATGAPSSSLLARAYLNARFQTGIPNPLDDAILSAGPKIGEVQGSERLDEVPYDFVRKRLSLLVREGPGAAPLLVTKGAVLEVLQICTGVEANGAVRDLDEAGRNELLARYGAFSREGHRVLAVATRPLGRTACSRADESAMTFAGFLLFDDPIKPDVGEAVADLAAAGIAFKVITGDNRYVAAHVAAAVGLSAERILTGAALETMSEGALRLASGRTDVFAEIDPTQKERIILALKKAGHAVGYLGDGINDAPSLHAADVGISVDTAVDVAKDAADLVLLDHDLRVLRGGIEEGRRTFANTLKYIGITTSANFGNMLTMALASFVLPFLPLVARQILLNNFVSDLPGIAIATDRVDPERMGQPERWRIREVLRFTVIFGSVSSVFDWLTFAILLGIFHTDVATFRTAWFVESLVTEIAIILVIRTYRPFYASRAGLLLLLATVGGIVAAVLAPYVPGAELFEFVPLPVDLVATLLAIAFLYVVASEAAKRIFFRR